MFISRKAHDLIVAELRNQIAELKAERNFYRRAWTKSRGQPFTSASSANAETSLPVFERSSPVQETFDADWTADDRDLFQRWAHELPASVDAEEEWKRLYGCSSPLVALTV
jgi:hypothetical protein